LNIEIGKMAKIKVNKIEAVRRQLDAAIRMLFANEDPLAIHTLSMAAFRILRDLAAKHDDSYMHKVVGSMIKPGMEKEFWKFLHGPSNFLKHADKDSEAILNNIDEKVNDFIILISCFYYQDLGYQYTPEMITLVSWCTALFPDFLRENSDQVFRDAILEARSTLIGKSRKEQLAMGQEILKLARVRI
ncbi:MAG: hypothetical protein KAU41_00525, partial [Deltaproteobacteria bacterium]|nr:hypothetical protein [Deltaproteobacteria bacterium]